MGAGGNRAFPPPDQAVKLGYHAPAPGSRSGVADYAERLRLELSRFFEVERGAAEADVHLYHLGNNKLHTEIYQLAMARPGIVVLHDAVLHHFFLGARDREGYLAEWEANYGRFTRDLGEELWRDRAKSAVDPRYFQYGMIRPIMERSERVIVHNPGAAAMAREHGARSVVIIPHYVEPELPPDAFDISRFRQRLSVPPGTILFGIFGYLREPKRIAQCLSAFRRLHSIRPNTALLLAGEIVSPDLARLIGAETEFAGILRLNHMTGEDLRLATSSVDCCLNLRYPAAGETSGISTRVMASGVATIVTDSAENRLLPDGAVLKVSPGPAEAHELFLHMLMVTDHSDIRKSIAVCGREYVRTAHALDLVVEQYRTALWPD